METIITPFKYFSPFLGLYSLKASEKKTPFLFTIPFHFPHTSPPPLLQWNCLLITPVPLQCTCFSVFSSVSHSPWQSSVTWHPCHILSRFPSCPQSGLLPSTSSIHFKISLILGILSLISSTLFLNDHVHIHNFNRCIYSDHVQIGIFSPDAPPVSQTKALVIY